MRIECDDTRVFAAFRTGQMRIETHNVQRRKARHDEDSRMAEMRMNANGGGRARRGEFGDGDRSGDAPHGEEI